MKHKPESVKSDFFQNSDFFNPGDTAQVKYEMLRARLVIRKTFRQGKKSYSLSPQHFIKKQSGIRVSCLYRMPSPRRRLYEPEASKRFPEDVKKLKVELFALRLAFSDGELTEEKKYRNTIWCRRGTQ
jgi:hypothetical protein